jgi:hypothetical protein
MVIVASCLSVAFYIYYESLCMMPLATQFQGRATRQIKAKAFICVDIILHSQISKLFACCVLYLLRKLMLSLGSLGSRKKKSLVSKLLETRDYILTWYHSDSYGYCMHSVDMKLIFHIFPMYRLETVSPTVCSARYLEVSSDCLGYCFAPHNSSLKALVIVLFLFIALFIFNYLNVSLILMNIFVKVYYCKLFA